MKRIKLEKDQPCAVCFGTINKGAICFKSKELFYHKECYKVKCVKSLQDDIDEDYGKYVEIDRLKKELGSVMNNIINFVLRGDINKVNDETKWDLFQYLH